VEQAGSFRLDRVDDMHSAFIVFGGVFRHPFCYEAVSVVVAQEQSIYIFSN
jgi:hypothetical protein